MAANAFVECECPYCYDMYDIDLHRPRLLKCGHDVCSACLLQLHDKMHGRGARCPVCREVDRTPINDLPTVFKLIPDQKQTTANNKCSSSRQGTSETPSAPLADSVDSTNVSAANNPDDLIRDFAKRLNISSKYLRNLNQILWLMEGVASKRAANGYICSPQFLTGRPGYKFQAKFYLNGLGSRKNSHVSGFVRICRGEFDAQLQWPCPYTFRLEIVDLDNPTKLSAAHHDIGWPVESESERVAFMKPIGDFNARKESPQLLHQSEAFSKRFCRDDTMLIRVSCWNEGIKLLEISQLLNIRKNFLKTNQNLWLIEDVTAKKAAKCVIFSPKFRTGQPGYKFQVEFYLNGVESGENSHVSGFVRICRGEFDEQLQWPCPYTFRLEIVDLDNPKKLSAAHHDIGWSVDGESARDDYMKPVSDFNTGRGFPEFLSQSEAFSSKFCRDDKILIRLTIYRSSALYKSCRIM